MTVDTLDNIRKPYRVTGMRERVNDKWSWIYWSISERRIYSYRHAKRVNEKTLSGISCAEGNKNMIDRNVNNKTE